MVVSDNLGRVVRVCVCVWPIFNAQRLVPDTRIKLHPYPHHARQEQRRSAKERHCRRRRRQTCEKKGRSEPSECDTALTVDFASSAVRENGTAGRPKMMPSFLFLAGCALLVLSLLAASSFFLTTSGVGSIILRSCQWGHPVIRIGGGDTVSLSSINLKAVKGKFTSNNLYPSHPLFTNSHH